MTARNRVQEAEDALAELGDATREAALIATRQYMLDNIDEDGMASIHRDADKASDRIEEARERILTIIEDLEYQVLKATAPEPDWFELGTEPIVERPEEQA